MRNKQLMAKGTAGNGYHEVEPVAAGGGLFERNPRLLLAALLLLFFLAAAARLYRLEAPGMLIDRDFTSAILAHDFYLQRTDDGPEWRKEIAHRTRLNQPILEPPVTEWLASWVFQIMHGEQLWAVRLLTTAFWLTGGIFLFEIVSALVSKDAAVFGLAYYLFLPLSILLSRSFQPDSLMMMLYLAALLAIVRYGQRGSNGWLLAAGITSGVALLVRPLVLFPTFGAFAAVIVHKEGSWKALLRRPFLLFSLLSLIFPLLYYGYGIVFAGFMRWKIQSSFRPDLYLHREYWKGWLELAVAGLGYAALIGAGAGFALLQKSMARAVMIGLALGHVVFGLVFTMHIHTHGYYQAQLIPTVAIAASVLVAVVADKLRHTADWKFWLPSLLGVLLLVTYVNVREVRRNLGFQVYESVQTDREIGELVNHSDSVLFLSRYYGMPLQYYGELTGSYWPRSITYYLYRRDEPELSISERVANLSFTPEYFVITDFGEYNRNHADLKAYLGNCPLLAQTDNYLVYEFCDVRMPEL